MFLQETYELVDYRVYDDASSNKVSQNYGSNISLRNSGTATLSYDSTNHNYDIVVSTTGESFFPITSATGLTDFTVEFDTFFPSQNSDVLNGLIVYKDSNNWYRVGYMPHSTRRRSIGDMNGGTWNETSSNVSSFPLTTWVHYKATISNGTLSVELSYNGTTYDTYSVSVSGLLTNSTKYGFVSVWASGRHAPFKNLKIKAL